MIPLEVYVINKYSKVPETCPLTKMLFVIVIEYIASALCVCLVTAVSFLVIEIDHRSRILKQSSPDGANTATTWQNHNVKHTHINGHYTLSSNRFLYDTLFIANAIFHKVFHQSQQTRTKVQQGLTTLDFRELGNKHAWCSWFFWSKSPAKISK